MRAQTRMLGDILVALAVGAIGAVAGSVYERCQGWLRKGINKQVGR